MDEKKTKDVLDFLLSSYRAKMAIENTTDNCPFDFQAFLSTWKERGQDWGDLKASMHSDLEPLMTHGLFDSILPYLSSSMNQSAANKEYLQAEAAANDRLNNVNNPIISTELISLTPVKSSAGPSSSKDSSKGKSEGSRRGSAATTSSYGVMDDEKSEIIIHVCDEAKGIREDFRCVQSVLVQEMGYFSKVTVKGQRLRDMDISVHCDIGVFGWLMKWMKHKMEGSDMESPPKLEPTNVIGLMVSAEFLQMPTLTTECLQFTSENIDQVVLHSPNLGCLNESLTSRLACQFNNLEVENKIVKIDKNDRISSRLYTQMIISLNDPEPDMSRGHYVSTISLFRCHTCGKLLINDIAPKVPCTAMRFDCRGRIYSCHVKDSNWSLVNYILDLKRDLKTWRRVYWRLWATVHFLSCSTCQLFFPAKDFSSCRFHPQPPLLSKTMNTPTEVEQPKPPEKHTGECINPFRRSREASINLQDNCGTEVQVETLHSAFGTHPCCKKSGYKYYTLPPTNGCHFRDHNVAQYAEDDPIVHRILSFRDVIIHEPQENTKPFEWGGIVDLTPLKLPIAPSPSPWNLGPRSSTTTGITGPGAPGFPRTLQPAGSTSTDSASLSDTEDGTVTADSKEAYYYSSARAPQVSEFWSWNPDFTTRYNQDMQREREEKLMTDLELLLSQRVSLETSGASSLQNMRLGYMSRRTPKNLGGSYIKLEEKWREEQLRANKSQRLGTKSAKP